MKSKVAIFSAIVLLIILIVINFPIYRLTTFLGLHNFYSWEEMQKVMYIGTPCDRADAKDVMNLANIAFVFANLANGTGHVFFYPQVR